MKLKYHNVGSIKDAEVEYKPGQLVAIVGESNQGKSLQFYSLLDGFTNSPAFKRYINNEALAKDSKAYESIELIDDTGGHWQVTASNFSMSYKVDGMKFEKPRRDNIFELSKKQIPGLLYDPENCTPIMNIVDEDTGMFPIDRSDAQIFKTYERLLSLSCTEDILRAIKLDMEDIDYNVTDRLKTIQQSQVTIQKIADFFNAISEEALTKMISDLTQLKQRQVFLTNLYNSTSNIANYIVAVDSVNLTQTDFNIKDFQLKLALLVQANNITNYCNKVDKVEIREFKDFDLQRATKLGQDLSVAMQLNQDILSLEEQIKKDETLLKEIEDQLRQIKVCPLCGHSMEAK